MNDKLWKIYHEISEDPFWNKLRENSNPLVKGVGNCKNPKAFVVGEAPGAQEALAGEPFVGRSGMVFWQLMEFAGLSKENSWVTNVIKYRPPANRTPAFHEIEHSKPSLRKEWAAVGAPRYLIAVGSVAKTAIGTYSQVVGSMGMFSGKLFPANDEQLQWVCTMYHPAFGLRRPEFRGYMENDWTGLGPLMEENDAWMRETGRLK